MFEHKNEYPVILIPGVIAYGEESKLHKTFPYFGMTATGFQNVITNNLGIECHTVSFEVLSSVWDRACELYAQLVGGTVDYGAAHSAKYGHARYGKTYEKPMLKAWDKITLVAHGFGAPVARLFIELLYNGSEEEKNATPAGELSDLFRGGFRGKIHALVTIAGIKDGISTAEALEGRFPGAKKLMTKAATAADMLLQYKSFVDPYYKKGGIPLTQHNLRAYIAKEPAGSKLKFSEDAIDSYLRKNDNIFYDMGPWGMQTLNSELYAFDDIYYLSYSGEVTRTVLGRATLPKLKAGVTLPFATLISTFENYLPEAPIITKKDQDNDGLVNTNSSMPPINEEAAVFRAAEYCQPGIWYQMPIENRNHFSFTGLFVRPDRYLDDIYNLMEIVCNLE
jgi:triacylglycerol lipase